MNAPRPNPEALSATDLTAQRRLKLDTYLSRGGLRYPNENDIRIQPSAFAAELLTRFAESTQQDLLDNPSDTVTINGRLMALRAFGKLIFAQLQDASSRIQISLSVDHSGTDIFSLFNDCIDIGDLLSVTGTMSRTNKGELTLQVRSFVLLSKAMHPLPDKWHGLADVEQRYRQRYLDLITSTETRETFLIRSRAITAIRRYLDDHGFLEVETPVLQHQAGGALARPFKTHHNALDIPLNMRIAPELFLKRLLVGGIERVYELSRNFRNEGISTRHNPEFTMLEWYAAYGTRESMMTLMEDLLRHVVQTVRGGTSLPYSPENNQTVIDFAPAFARYTMRDAVLAFSGLTEADLTDHTSLLAAAKARGVSWKPDDIATYGELLQACFEEFVEPKLIQPTFIMDHPSETSPLTRLYPDDQQPAWAKALGVRLTQRAELYIAGREHGEFYSELNDPDDQRARFERQMEAARQGSQEAMPFDHDFMHALEMGMPPAGGVGLGIDRLAMLLANQPSIRDVILFPLLRQKED